ERGQYVVKVNNRKVLDGVMEAIEITESWQKLAVMRSLDKLDKFEWSEVEKLLGAGRKDESGDFTKGANLSASQIGKMRALMSAWEAVRLRPSNAFQSEMLEEIVGKESPETLVSGLAELKTINELVYSAGYGQDRIRVDLSVVRGLEYYTGPVYEVEL